MIVGPVFTREAVVTPRRARLYIYRTVYAVGLFVLMCTAWLILAGTQVIRNIGDMARFGAILFQILAPLQLAIVMFLSTLWAASAVAQEKDRRTLILLLMTRMTNSELVLGKLFASFLTVITMLAAGLPVFMFAVLFGGVSFSQVGRIFVVTLLSALAAASLGSTVALWREKTFQTLAIVALALVFWLGASEAVARGVFGEQLLGISCQTWGEGLSPLWAVWAAAQPAIGPPGEMAWIGGGAGLFVIVALLMTAALNLVAIRRVRVWNPSHEVRRGQRRDAAEQASIWGAEYDLAQKAKTDASAAEQFRAGHVDSRLREGAGHRERTREVWDNPVLWREMRTWAYGRKILLIRLAYLALFLAALPALHWAIDVQAAAQQLDATGTNLPAAALPLVPFFLVSLLIINALAVTSITTERDGRSLDLLLATDLTPKEFLFGKLGGVFWVNALMVLMPMLLAVYLWWNEGLTTANLVFTLGGLLVMNLFVAMLGIHCGMIYAASRTAVSVSLGTVFFLFLGVATCIWIIISFSRAFEVQLLPFLGFILGGGLGLFVALGIRNPSAAMAWASGVLPLATFYAIVSFLTDKHLYAFLVASAAYGFAISAMMVPALGRFDIAMGRTTQAEE